MGKKKLFFQRSSGDTGMWLINAASFITNESDFLLYFTLTVSGAIKTFKIIGDDVFVKYTVAPNKYTFRMLPILNKPLTGIIITDPLMQLTGSNSRPVFTGTPLEVFDTPGDFGSREFFYRIEISPSQLKLRNFTAFDESISSINNGLFQGLKLDGTTLDLTKITNMKVRCSDFVRGNAGNVIDMSNCTNILNDYGAGYSCRVFSYCYATILLYKLTSIGLGNDHSVDYTTFYLVDSRTTIYVNNFMRTANNGSENATIAYARSRGATIYFTDDNGTVIP